VPLARQRRWTVRIAPLPICAAICLIAYSAGRGGPAGAAPWYSIVPPLVAVGMALATNRVFPSLGVGVVVGGLLHAGGSSSAGLWWPLTGLADAARCVGQSVWPASGDPAHLQILLLVVLMMAMVSVTLVGGGLHGVAQWLARYARSPQSTQFVTVLMGLAVFFDDYANTMIVGPTMRPLSDRQRVSREKLAFIVDATAAPVAGIALVSTWIGYEVGLLGKTADSLGLAKDGYAMFLDAVGFRYYCLGMIAFMVANALSGEDFAAMAGAERRARQLGKPLDDGARPLTTRAFTAVQPHPRARVLARVGIVPVLCLLLAFLGGMWATGGGWAAFAADRLAPLRISVWREALNQADNNLLLTVAAAFGLLVAVLMTLAVSRAPAPAAAKAMLLGARSSLLPIAILVMAWSLTETCGALGTGPFLASILVGSLPPAIYPPLVFVVACLISFATGTSWGTMAILIPTALPVAFQLDGQSYGLVTMISIAAVLDGAIFGDHCSPISDTTILSSAASSCDHLAHVRTQLPYSLLVAGLALSIGYVPAALGVPCWVGSLGSAAVSAVLFLGLWLFRRRPHGLPAVGPYQGERTGE